MFTCLPITLPPYLFVMILSESRAIIAQPFREYRLRNGLLEFITARLQQPGTEADICRIK
jgi:hypothetical protein